MEFVLELQSTLPKSNSHKSNNRLSWRSFQVLFSSYSIVFNPSQVEFSLSRSYVFSPNRFDLGKVDCSYFTVVKTYANLSNLLTISHWKKINPASRCHIYKYGRYRLGYYLFSAGWFCCFYFHDFCQKLSKLFESMGFGRYRGALLCRAQT